eukprot:6286160-Amphidinium_carterae.1
MERQGTWDEATVDDQDFQKALDMTRGKDPREQRARLLATRECDQATLCMAAAGSAGLVGYPGGDVGRVKALPGRSTEPPEVALVCYICCEVLLAHKLEGGEKSFKTADGKPSRFFRNMAEGTKPLAADRDRKMKRWTEWGNDVNKHQRVYVNPETLSRLAAEYAGGEDWVSMMGNGRVSLLYSCPHCGCAPLRMNGWVRGTAGGKKKMWFCPACIGKWNHGTGNASRWIL